MTAALQPTLTTKCESVAVAPPTVFPFSTVFVFFDTCFGKYVFPWHANKSHLNWIELVYKGKYTLETKPKHDITEEQAQSSL